MNVTRGRHLPAILLVTLLVAVSAGAPRSWAAGKDVTAFIYNRTFVPQTVDREWRKNCPELLCGTMKQKGARVVQVHMNKTSKTTVRVKGKVVARASFGVLSPLSDTQTIFVSGDADPIACTFKLDKLLFTDGVAQFLIDLFAGLEGKVYPFRDRRGKCDQFFPKDL